MARIVVKDLPRTVGPDSVDMAGVVCGGRASVEDDHDRYANAEVSYLLQRMEVHAGLVTLASNLRK